MGSTLTVRNVDPEDKSWLQRQALQVGVSMEEFVRSVREHWTIFGQSPKSEGDVSSEGP